MDGLVWRPSNSSFHIRFVPVQFTDSVSERAHIFPSRMECVRRSPAKDVHLAEADERDGGHASHGQRFFTSDEDVTSERRKSHITDAPGGGLVEQ